MACIGLCHPAVLFLINPLSSHIHAPSLPFSLSLSHTLSFPPLFTFSLTYTLLPSPSHFLSHIHDCFNSYTHTHTHTHTHTYPLPPPHRSEATSAAVHAVERQSKGFIPRTGLRWYQRRRDSRRTHTATKRRYHQV